MRFFVNQLVEARTLNDVRTVALKLTDPHLLNQQSLAVAGADYFIVNKLKSPVLWTSSVGKQALVFYYKRMLYYSFASTNFTDALKHPSAVNRLYYFQQHHLVYRNSGSVTYNFRRYSIESGEDPTRFNAVERYARKLLPKLLGEPSVH